MRPAFLAIAMTLALAGCGKEQATGNTNAFDQAVTAEDFETGDTTAIDAATGAAANMAADVDITAIGNDSGNRSSSTSASPARASRPAPATAGNSSASPAAESDEPAESTEPAASEPAETNSN